MAEVLYVYRAPSNGDWYPGVPNTDITDEQWARFTMEQRRTVESAKSAGIAVWVPFAESDETEQERIEREAAEAAAREAFVRGNRTAKLRDIAALVPGPGEVIVGGADGPVKVPYMAGSGNRVVALGDSLTIGNGDRPNGILGNTSWYTWAGLLSGGRIRTVRGGNAGVAGQNAEMIRTRIESHIAPLDADYCVVLAGTNDMTATPDIAGTMSHLIAIYDELAAIGKRPVAATIPPRTTNGTQVPALNYHIAHHAAQRGMPVIDFYSALVDPATGAMRAEYNTDGIHPNEAGAKAMGQVAAQVLTSLPGFVAPLLVGAVGDTGNLLPNGVFIGDVNTDGVADTWTPTGTGGVATYSLSSDADALGNWQRVTTAESGLRYFQSVSSTGWDVGDRVLFAGKIRSDVENGAFGYYPRIQFNGGSGFMGVVNNGGMDLDDAAWAMEGVIPIGTTSMRVQLQTKNSGTGWIEFAQVTLLNLTRLGLA